MGSVALALIWFGSALNRYLGTEPNLEVVFLQIFVGISFLLLMIEERKSSRLRTKLIDNGIEVDEKDK